MPAVKKTILPPMTQDDWKKINERQKKIMEKDFAESKGKPYHTLKVGKRVPGTPVKPTTKKK